MTPIFVIEFKIYIYIYILESKSLPLRGQLPVAVASLQYSNFKKVSLPVARCLWQMPQTLLQQIAAPTEPNSFIIFSVAASPWQWHRRNSSIAKGNVASSAVPVANATNIVALWQAPCGSGIVATFPLPSVSLSAPIPSKIHGKSILEGPWGCPGLPRGVQVPFCRPRKAPRAAREPPQGPRGRPRDGP